ncbi:DUF2798 domain-containing protein [Pontibacter harenae]|uniref:DUF2798 domain-containing protein n=1 Tax=Pontibacter harenae TaxID=2894083 RepID=UPI001E2F29E0|nr:DUF2798 domain-containing protein [Pontibacter harenae]MCC9165824.1 DUF2798 domain-containing protein [Pontibacter harenae]
MKKIGINPKLKRQLKVIAIMSLLVASAIELYTFGLASDFLLRWFRAFFVVFLLVSVTALAIVPFVNFVTSKMFRK